MKKICIVACLIALTAETALPMWIVSTLTPFPTPSSVGCSEFPVSSVPCMFPKSRLNLLRRAALFVLKHKAQDTECNHFVIQDFAIANAEDTEVV